MKLISFVTALTKFLKLKMKYCQGLSDLDSSHAQRHIDAKNLTHPTSCLSAKLSFSTKIDKLMFCSSVRSLKFFTSGPSRKFSVLGHFKSVHIPLESTNGDNA